MNDKAGAVAPWGQFPVAERPANYPDALEQYVTLRDGRRVFIRPVIPADELVLEKELLGIDSETLVQRFFTSQPRLDAKMRHSLYNIDYRWRLALLACAEDGQAVGIGRYEGVPDREEAEIAFVVKPGWRRVGLSATLLQLLVDSARTQGIQRLLAFCLQENLAMSALLTKFGFDLPKASDGVAFAEKQLY